MGPVTNNPAPNEIDMQDMATTQAAANPPQQGLQQGPRQVNIRTPQWAIDQLRALRNIPNPQPVVAEDAMDLETETPPPPGQPLRLRERGVHVETILVLVDGQPLPARLYTGLDVRIT